MFQLEMLFSLLFIFLLQLGSILSTKVNPTVLLHNAVSGHVEMPTVGLGVGSYGGLDGRNGQYWNDSIAEEAVYNWIQLGGRRIDTSLMWYHDLSGVGSGIRRSGIPRNEIFITSKVDPPYGIQTTLQHVDEILSKLKTEYVDLILMHWPAPIAWNFTTLNVSTTEAQNQPCGDAPKCRRDTWTALQQVLKEGKTRAIGVANFNRRHLDDLKQMEHVLMPAVNQFELHPYWFDEDLVEHCLSLNITVNGYSPLGAPDYMAWLPKKWPIPLLDQPLLGKIGGKYNKTPAQVLIRWELQLGAVVNPRSWNIKHMEENLHVFDFELSQEEMDAITNDIPPPLRRKVCPDPEILP